MSDHPQITVEVSKSKPKEGRPAWFVGAVLIIVGLAFIVKNIDLPGIREGNWWAVFIMIPIVAILDDIYHIYAATPVNKAGAIISKVIGMLVLGAVMVIFLFGVNLGIYWPVLLIAAGLVFLVAALIK